MFFMSNCKWKGITGFYIRTYFFHPCYRCLMICQVDCLQILNCLPKVHLVFSLIHNVQTIGDLLSVIADFLGNRKERVVLNDQISSWVIVTAGVPQGSILGPLFFLIYINDLSDKLLLYPKLFAGNTSLFSVIKKHECIFEIIT